VFIPFGLLSGLNYIIVTILRRQQRSASMFRFGSSEHKIKARSATRLLILIVFSYLLANALNVVVMSWEVIDMNSTNDYFWVRNVLFYNLILLDLRNNDRFGLYALHSNLCYPFISIYFM
jgi:hypothetical protein